MTPKVPEDSLNTLVLQSHRTPLPYKFLDPCLASVASWANAQGFTYRRLGDELFRLLPADIKARLAGRTLVATDIARLQWMQWALDQGFERVVWLDADVLVLDPDALLLPALSFAVGRETWVQPHTAHANRAKLYRKVHNAVLMSSRQDSTLPFYLDAAQRLVLANTGHMPDQFVGPKLLSALHNLVRFGVIENVDMLPPAVALDLLQGDGVFLARYRLALTQQPAALNLCSSSVARGLLSERQMDQVVDLLSGFTQGFR